MADVLFVCVRADIERAEMLADAFEAAGFSVDGAPADHADVNDAGAAIIFWSEASLRSREFLATAQRYMVAGNALVVCLNDAPPVTQVDGAPLFDLSDWDGEPEQLASLLRAVDRKINAPSIIDVELAPSAVALIENDDELANTEVSPSETEYFSLHGADAYAGLPVAWSAPEAPRADPPDVSDRPARRYRVPRAPVSLLRHGGALARVMALVLLVGGGVAFAATSLTPRQAPVQPVASQDFVEMSMPLNAVMEAGAPMPDFVPEPEQFAQVQAPSYLREPESAPRGARFEPTSDYVAPAPQALWLDTLHDEPAPAGAPLIAAAQDAVVLGSSDLPDEMFKPEPAAKPAPV
jgi:hypothetical protein